MTSGIYSMSATLQANSSYGSYKIRPGDTKKPAAKKTDMSNQVEKNSFLDKFDIKEWSPIDTTSSLVPTKTEYGDTIGQAKLSDTAKDYYESLKHKFQNANFILVSNDLKDAVKQNAAAYGNSDKMVVLIDEAKLERMASDKSFRKKYEGIIAMAETTLKDARNSLISSGASVKSFGMSVDEDGKQSFFATVEKSQDLQKERIEKKTAAKKELKAKEQKAERKERQHKAEIKKKAEKAEAKKAEAKRAELREDQELQNKKSELRRDAIREELIEEELTDNGADKEYVTIESNSLQALLHKVSDYTFSKADFSVRTAEERAIGGHIDFRG
ncbi:MAG: DUF6033 family protein [Lachnospiraceae bacterium]|nr:DUF6033 family protein [Lachnospiraceae bacterium]